MLDTPGLFDTEKDQATVCREIAGAINTYYEGVHAFLYILNAASHRFTDEDKTALAEIKVI